MGENKVCPLKLQKGIYFGGCNKKDCAWYCERTGDYTVPDTANHIRWFANIGLKVEDKKTV